MPAGHCPSGSSSRGYLDKAAQRQRERERLVLERLEDADPDHDRSPPGALRRRVPRHEARVAQQRVGRVGRQEGHAEVRAHHVVAVGVGGRVEDDLVPGQSRGGGVGASGGAVKSPRPASLVHPRRARLLPPRQIA